MIVITLEECTVQRMKDLSFMYAVLQYVWTKDGHRMWARMEL